MLYCIWQNCSLWSCFVVLILCESTFCLVTLPFTFVHYPALLSRGHLDVLPYVRSCPTSKGDIYSPDLFCQYTLEHLHRKEHCFVVFTDGSKNAEDAGSAAVSSGFGMQLSLPCYALVFITELQAIASALPIISQDHPPSSVIYSDSHGITATIACYTSPKCLITGIQSTLQDLPAGRLSTELWNWIPAHVDIRGNKHVDMTAKDTRTLLVLDGFLLIDDWLAIIKPFIYQDWQIMVGSLQLFSLGQVLTKNIDVMRSSWPVFVLVTLIWPTTISCPLLAIPRLCHQLVMPTLLLNMF